jgi:hypothetical protein
MPIQSGSTFVALLAIAAAVGAHGPITASAPVQVSAARASREHSEVRIAAGPRDANRLVACAIVVGEDPHFTLHFPFRSSPMSPPTLAQAGR